MPTPPRQQGSLFRVRVDLKVPGGEIVVGRMAVNNAVRDPESTIFSIKRLMGRVYGEEKVDEVKQRFNFHLAPPRVGPRCAAMQ